jgi:predicted methyltransferase
MQLSRQMILSVSAAFLIGACSQSEPEAPVSAEPAMEAAAEMEQDLTAILSSDTRSEEDRARDASRKPSEVLDFLGIETGMDLVDLMAAGGWYSEVLSLTVGADGSVAAQNPPFILAFRDGANGIALDKRIGARLTNVTRVDSSWAELGASGAQYDAAISALNIHDAYYLQSPEAAAEMLSSTYAVLKPGGVLGIIDHNGNAGADNNALHRIEKSLAIELALAAGFLIEGDSSLLSNSGDDHTLMVFDEGIRGKTDRFLLKLRKPAS